jgi:hypothetical protein
LVTEGGKLSTGKTCCAATIFETRGLKVLVHKGFLLVDNLWKTDRPGQIVVGIKQLFALVCCVLQLFVAVTPKRGIEVGLKILGSHDALVFMAHRAPRCIKVKVALAEATYEV